MASRPDHVVLLSVDALRADHLSCYGYHRATTPNIDALAADAIRFTRAYSQSSHTREAIPALLTGEYPDVAVDGNYRLVADTIADSLSNAGFATAAFHSNPYASRAFGFDRGFDEFDDDLYLGRHRLVALAQRAFDKLRNRHYARAPEINDRSLAWLDSLDTEASVFLWNHYMDPHGPYEPPSEYRARYHNASIPDSEAQSLYHRAIERPDSITAEDRRLLIDLYDAEIRYADRYIGAFIEALRDRAIYDDCLLVVTADHGDAFGEHGYYEHPRYLHDELTHVPLLVRPPGGAAGEEVTTPVSTLSVAATIEAAIGHGTASPQPSLLGAAPTEGAVFMQARGEGEKKSVRRFAIRSPDGACFCEYDRRAERIRFGDCADGELRTALRAHVEDRLQQRHPDEAADTATDVDEDIERRLSALGYKE
jgi:arylsulfatase